jgi:AraC family transcriptional regulator
MSFQIFLSASNRRATIFTIDSASECGVLLNKDRRLPPRGFLGGNLPPSKQRRDGRGYSSPPVIFWRAIENAMNSLDRPSGPVRPIERTSRASGGPIDFDLLKRKSWPGISAECVRLVAPVEYDFRIEAASNFLVLLDLQRADGETVANGSPPSYRKNLRHRLSFVPMGSAISGWSRIVKPASFTALYFDPLVLDEARCDLSQIPAMVEFEDNMLRTTMLQFDALLNDPYLDHPGYPETLAILLAFELGRLKKQTKASAAPRSGLPQWQVRVVVDYLENHLADRTSISELAALLHLSRFHFIRAFKKTVGMPPHQFILRRRVERARELLAANDLSVSEVAERTGFNGAAQLSRAFRQIVGVTPTDFRRGP